MYEPASNYCRYGSSAITKIGDESTDAITSVPRDVSCYNTKTASHFLFKVDANDVLPSDGPVAVVQYYITSEDATSTSGISRPGKHYFVTSDNILVASNFDTTTEGWTYTDNGKKSPALTYDGSRITSSSGASLSKFVFLADEFQNPDVNGVDQDLWKFVAPSKFSGDQAMAYKGQLCFTLGKASGDFSSIQAGGGDDLHVVELECATCVDRDGKKGTRIALPYSKLPTPFTGATVTQCITLDESAGWLMDPENSNDEWLTPTACEFVTLLHRLSSLKVLDLSLSTRCSLHFSCLHHVFSACCKVAFNSHLSRFVLCCSRMCTDSWRLHAWKRDCFAGCRQVDSWCQQQYPSLMLRGDGHIFVRSLGAGAQTREASLWSTLLAEKETGNLYFHIPTNACTPSTMHAFTAPVLMQHTATCAPSQYQAGGLTTVELTAGRTKKICSDKKINRCIHHHHQQHTGTSSTAQQNIAPLNLLANDEASNQLKSDHCGPGAGPSPPSLSGGRQVRA